MLPAALPALSPDDIKDGVLVTASLIGALTVIIGALVRVWQLQREAILKQQHNAELLAAVVAQVLPNHGTSLRDAIDRVETGMDDLRHEMAGLRDENARTVARVDDAYSLLAKRADSNRRRRHDDPPPD